MGTSCGPKSPSPVKDCDKRDMGSCGNACCVVDVSTDFSHGNSTDLYEKIKQFLMKGGDDGSYTYVTGPDAAGNNPVDDLTPYKIAWKYMIKGTHKTTGGYIDSVWINIKVVDNNLITRFGSISEIHGALGDNGQTFKNIAVLFESNFVQPPMSFSIIHGCGQV